MDNIKISATELLEILGMNKIKECTFTKNSEDLRFSIYAEDIQEGQIFIALNSSKYSNLDGGLGFTNNEDSVYGFGGYIDINEKIELALQKGASVIIVDDVMYYQENSKVLFLLVKDSLWLITQIAKLILEKSRTKIIAVTGSTGKTTTTTALCNFLSIKYKVKRLHRIRNSVLGMSIDIIQHLCAEDDFLIVEMQMDGVGQIEQFCKITPPDFAIITGVNLAHYSRMGSMEAIFNEKIQVYNLMKKNGKCIINGDDKLLAKWKKGMRDERIYEVSLRNDESEIFINNIDRYGTYNFHEFTLNIRGDNCGRYKVNAPGVGTLYGAAFALYLAKELNFTKEDIYVGLSQIKYPIGRFQGLRGLNNSLVIVDSYNASYCSVKGGLDYLTTLQYKKKIVVLGSMMELGDKTEIEHKKIGKYIEKYCDLTHLITLGEAAMYIAKEVKSIPNNNLYSVYDYEDVINILMGISIDESTVLYFKGSGAMRMEFLVPYVLAERVF